MARTEIAALHAEAAANRNSPGYPTRMTALYRFEGFHLNPATRELHQGDALVALPARAFDCLAYLIEHRDRAVGRDELIAAVWGRVEVSDTLLSHTVVKIRRALGDTGNEQRTVRTVPRFGYRWTGAIESVPSTPDAPASIAAPEQSPEPSPEPASPAPADVPAALATPALTPRTRSRELAFVACAAVVVIALAAGWLGRTRPAPVALGPAPTTHGGSAEALVAPALVLPAEITAPDEWRWLRLGLMDLVATRLRDGALPTVPSESVVGLLKQRGVAADPLHDPQWASVASLRVLPRVDFDGRLWRVRLDASGAQRSLSVEAQADDAIAAARTAADLLLRKLGHAPSSAAAPSSPALDDLLQRSGAAMLADQLDQARDLIAHAPPELQQQPRIEHRMAQIELRAGDYAAVERRLPALLDRLASSPDAALRARVLITLAAAQVRQNQPERAAELYEEAIELRRGQHDFEALGVAYLGRGVVLAQAVRLDEATSELSRARIELEMAGDALGVASVDVNLGDLQLLRHRPADALPILKQAAHAFEQLGAREGLAHALVQQASAEREMLDHPAALATTARFWPPEAHTNNLRMRWTLTRARADALAGIGRSAEAQALIERIGALADPRADAETRAYADALAAQVAWLRGDAGAAAQSVAGALVPALRDADPATYTRALHLRLRALRAPGQDADADADADAAMQALRAWADDAGDDWRAMYAALAEAERAWAAGRREPALEQFSVAMRAAERFNVPEDLVAVGAPYVAALIAASQLDSARAVSGRIAPWADRDLRAATAQAHLFRALGQDDAAHKAEEAALRIAGERSPASGPAVP